MTARRYFFTAAIALLTLPCAAGAVSAAGIFTLSSTTFEDGKLMPKNVSNNAANSKNNPNCVVRMLPCIFPGPTCPTAPRALYF